MPTGPEYSSSAHREAVELMRVLARGLVIDEALAGEIAEIARTAERECLVDEAEALRAIARNHRIRALEAQGYLAALREIYGPVPGDNAR